MDKKVKRDIALDVIRSIALFCVISVHFFEHVGYYKETVIGTNMLAMTIMRNSFMVCVPLFIMLTGYLVMSTQINLSYYKKIIKVLFVYIAASILCVLFKVFILQEGMSVWQAIWGILSFKSAPYSWYIEMYIGLFLIIPFLNILYEGLNKRGKQILLITLFVLTILPSMVNIFSFAGIEWWMMPSKASAYDRVVPQWWINIYPITYFYLGRYLREYPVKIRISLNAVLIILVTLFAGGFNYYRSYNSVFIYGLWQEYGSFFVTVQTVLVFILFSRLEYKGIPLFFKTVITKISKISLGAYLTSWIFDKIVYTVINNKVTDMSYKFLLYPVAVGIVFAGSLMLSAVIDYVYENLKIKV